MLDSCRQVRHGSARIRGGRNRAVGKEAPVHVRDRNGDLGRSDVGYQNRSPIIQTQKGGAPSAWQSAGWAVHDPFLMDELLGNQRNGTALQAGNTRQVRARD